MRYYEYYHKIGFEETNVVGNVYFVNHLRWQGRCRELFLRDHAPEVLAQIEEGLILATTRCACEYLAELSAFEEVAIRMRLGGLSQNRILLRFEYWRAGGSRPELVARGEQQVACMIRRARSIEPAPIPRALWDALEPYREAAGSETGYLGGDC